MTRDTAYETLLMRGRAIYAPTRIGRPGRGWAYWPMFVLAQALRLKWSIHVTGAGHLPPDAAILVGNHLSLMDPVMVGVTNRSRMSFFTKAEAFESSGGAFFRLAGQIPLRRGDEVATQWALEMSDAVMRAGVKLCVYPEGTRSPDGRSLHRLHRRVLVPILQANPDVPVHAMTVGYSPGRLGRVRVDLRFSAPLDVDVSTMTADAVTDAVRDALLGLGGMPYVHSFGRSAKSNGRAR